MEYIQGITLRDKLTREQITALDALHMARQVADALGAAHAAGIVHRDIKPENIMLRPDGYVKVLDFGLAKLVGLGNADFGLGIDESAAVVNTSSNPQSEIRIPHSTLPGLVMGTSRYMSPEQARGLPVDSSTDIWSLGVVLYEMVAARPPFEGATPTDVIISIVEKEPPPLAQSAPGAPAQLEVLIKRALSKDREN